MKPSVPPTAWAGTIQTTDTGQHDGGRAISSQLEMARLADVVAALREHCPWTAALTRDSLTTYLLEESYELIEALEAGRREEIAGELGDILLQVVLHARLAQEDGSFDLADVARGLSGKLIRRSPHVFHADGTLQDSFPATIAEIEETWERVKAAERAGSGVGAGAVLAASPFSGIPRSLPALAMAQKTIERAERAGLSTGEPRGTPGGNIGTEAELGKVLFDVVRLAQQGGMDAERALRTAVREFQQGV